MIHGTEPMISLPATDVTRAVRFYTETLGMRVLFGNAERGFYLFGGDRDGPTTLGVHRAIGQPSAQHDIWFWLLVDDVREVREALARKGVRLVGDVQPRGPGDEQAFVDSEGNLVRLWSRLRELRRSVEIMATPDVVFAMVSEPRALERWMASIDNVELDCRAGGRVAFIDPLFGRVTGRVTTFAAPRRIAFEFDENWPRHLTIDVEPTSSGCAVHVHQSGFELIGDRDYGVPGLIERLDRGLEALRTALVPSVGAG